MINAQLPPPLAPLETVRAGQESPPLAPDAAVQRPDKVSPASAGAPLDMSQVLQASEQYFQQRNQHLSFSVDDASGRMVVSVIDTRTSEVIRQFPGEEALAVSRRLQQLIEENAANEGGLLIEKTT